MVKYLKQISIILLISLLGEVLNYLIPLPIPASVYGLIIMLICLCTKIVEVKHVKECSKFLLTIMPMLFVPSVVGIMDVWGMIAENIVPVLVIIFITTIIVMSVSALTTQGVIKLKKRKENKEDD